MLNTEHSVCDCSCWLRLCDSSATCQRIELSLPPYNSPAPTGYRSKLRPCPTTNKWYSWPGPGPGCRGLAWDWVYWVCLIIGWYLWNIFQMLARSEYAGLWSCSRIMSSEEEENVEVLPDPSEIEKWTMKELKAWLLERGLPRSGKKSNLVKRVMR